MIVLDASLALGWFLEPSSRSAAALRYVEDHGGMVPANFQSEVVHGLLRAERRDRIDQRTCAAVLTALLDLSLQTQSPDPMHIIKVAREHSLTGYDAAYLAVAIEHSLPLATADAALERAALATNSFWEDPT